MLSQPTRIATDPDDAAIADQATASLTMTTHRLQIAHRDRAKRFHAVLADIRSLALQGCNEQECRMYEVAVGAVIDSLFSGRAATCERVAERAELEADTREDHTHGTIHIEGETPTTLELHADALDKQAAASRTLAMQRRRRARAIREQRTTAQRRVGVAL